MNLIPPEERIRFGLGRSGASCDFAPQDSLVVESTEVHTYPKKVPFGKLNSWRHGIIGSHTFSISVNRTYLVEEMCRLRSDTIS